MSKNRRTKSTGTANSLIPSKGPVTAQHRPMPSSGGAKLYYLLISTIVAIYNDIHRAWEKEEEAKHLNININNNFNGNNININIVNRNLELAARTESRQIPGLDQKIDTGMLKQSASQKGQQKHAADQGTSKPAQFNQVPVSFICLQLVITLIATATVNKWTQNSKRSDRKAYSQKRCYGQTSG